MSDALATNRQPDIYTTRGSLCVGMECAGVYNGIRGLRRATMPGIGTSCLLFDNALSSAQRLNSKLFCAHGKITTAKVKQHEQYKCTFNAVIFCLLTFLFNSSEFITLACLLEWQKPRGIGEFIYFVGLFARLHFNEHSEV